MHPVATDLASGRLAPLTFDRLANPDGHVPVLADGLLSLAVQRGAYDGPVHLGWEPSARCEVREPGKIPLRVRVHHTFVLRLGAEFPTSPLRMVVAQLKLNGGDSPLFALRVHQGRMFADWRLAGFSVEHHDRLPGCARAWTRFDLISSADGAELLVDGDRISRIRLRMDPGLTRYLKIGPYRDRDGATRRRWSRCARSGAMCWTRISRRRPDTSVDSQLKRDVDLRLKSEACLSIRSLP